MKIKTLIIDDDPFMIDLLKEKLSQFFPEIEVLATAQNGTQGIDLIQLHQPELIFLDVEMGDMTGFEMLSKLKSINFQIIFITAYTHYAIKAIRFNALDYLVKPIDLSELKGAINRFKKNAQNNASKNRLKQAIDNFNTTNVAEQKLSLQTHSGELRLTLKDIISIEAERNYSYIYGIKHKKILVTKALGDLEELLNDKGFYRIHKSYLINARHIIQIQNKTSVLLTNDKTLAVSRRKTLDFLKWYQDFET